MAENTRIKKKTISARLTLAAAVYGTDKIHTGLLTLPKDFDEIIGWTVHVGDDSGVANADYEVALDDDNGELAPWEHIGGIATAKDDGCPPDLRFSELGPFPIRGAGDLTIKVKVPAQTTTADLKLVFSVRVSRSESRTS